MSFARKTYDTDSIVLRTVVARTPTDQNISSGKVLVAQGDGSTAWMYPSTLPGVPAFTRVIGNGTNIDADNLSSAIVFSTLDSMGMIANSTTKQISLYAKAFTTIDVSGGNAVTAFNTTNNTLTPTVELVGAGGIQIASDPQTNKIYFQTTVPAISTGIYGYSQVNVLSNTPSTITDSNFSTNNTVLTALSPSTVLQLAGLGDITLRTDVTNNVAYIGISTFTTASFQAVSTATGNLQTSGSTLSTTIGSNTSSLWFSTLAAANSTNTQFQANFNYINAFYTPLNDYQDLSTFTHSTLENVTGTSTFSTLQASTFNGNEAILSTLFVSSFQMSEGLISSTNISSAFVQEGIISSLVVSSLSGIQLGGNFSTSILYVQGATSNAVGYESLRYNAETSSLLLGTDISNNSMKIDLVNKQFFAQSDTTYPSLSLGIYPNSSNYSNLYIDPTAIDAATDDTTSVFTIRSKNLVLDVVGGYVNTFAISSFYSGDVLTDTGGNLGSDEFPWKSLHLFSSLYLSSTAVTVNTSGQLVASINGGAEETILTGNLSTTMLAVQGADGVKGYEELRYDTTTSTFTIDGLSTIAGHILPVDENRDLGSSTAPWRELYLSGASIYLSTTKISLDSNGALQISIGGSSNQPIGGTSSFTSTFTQNAFVSSLVASSITAVNFIYLSSVQDSYYISTTNLDAEEISYSTCFGKTISTQTILTSSINGVKVGDYVSTGQLTSSLTGLGAIGFVSSTQLTSTVTGLGNAGYVSSSQLVSTTNYLLSNATGSNISSLNISSMRSMVSAFTPIQVPASMTLNNQISGFIVGGVSATSSNSVKQGISDVITLTNATGVSYPLSTIIRSVAFNGSNWLMATSDQTPANGRVYRSDNGATWTQVTLSGNYPTLINKIIYASSFWFAVGSNGTNSNYTIARSLDGSNWTAASNNGFGGGSGGVGESIAYNSGNARLVAVGWYFTMIPFPQFFPLIKYSDDLAITWSNVTSITTTGLTLGLSVFFANNLWLAGFSRTTGCNLKYSANGLTWTDVTTIHFPQGVTDFAYGNSTWIALGGSNFSTIRYSSDGSNWNVPTGQFSFGGKGVVWSGSVFAAVGDDPTSTNKVKYSANGITWSNSSNADFSGEGRSIGYTSNAVPPTYTLDVGQTTRLSNVVVPGTAAISSLTASSFTLPQVVSISSLTVSTITQVGSATISSLTASSFALPTFITVSSFTASTIANATTANISSLVVSSISSAMVINNTLRVNGGNVGVNIAATQGTLEVSGTSANAEVVALYLRNNSTPASNVTTLGFGTASNSLIGQAQIAVGNVSTVGAGYMAFRTYSTLMRERVRIMDTGNVGIGTSTPSYTLDVAGDARIGYATGNISSFILNLGTSGVGSYRSAYIFSDGRNIAINNQQNGNFLIETNNGSAFIQMLSTGKVGIGTTPNTFYTAVGSSYTVDVLGTVRSQTEFICYNSTNNCQLSMNVGNGSIATIEAFNFNNTVKQPIALAPFGGNVGVAKANPGYIFEVGTDSAAKPGTNTWTISSDERLKTNISLANLDICYSTMKAIPLKRYTWRDDIYTPEQVADRSKIGWVAQDVEKVFSKAVTYTSSFGYDDCRGLNTDQLYAVTYGTTQKIIQIVEEHTSTLENVSTLYQTTEQRFSSLEGLLQITQSTCLGLQDEVSTLKG